MTLNQYIERGGFAPLRTQAEIAALIGISRSYLAEILSGEKQPGREAIRKIEVATAGSVPAATWFCDRSAA